VAQSSPSPAPQRRCQVAEAAAPQTETKKEAVDQVAIDEVQKESDKYSGRLKVTSWAFVVIGAVGAVSAIAHGLGARSAAERDIAQPPHHQRGGPHGGNHHDGAHQHGGHGKGGSSRW